MNLLLHISLLLLLQLQQWRGVHSFGLLGAFSKTQFVTKPLDTQNRQQDELRIVTELFVDSFWRGKVGGGTKELTESQNRTLQAQQFAEFRKRYARSSQQARMIVCKDTQKQNAIIGCAGVDIDTVATFAEGSEPRNGGSLLAILTGSNYPAKPTGRWDTKMQYAPIMSNLVVSRDYRRKGIAEELVQAVEDLCVDELGYDICYLLVEKRNAPALKLYQKLGYNTIWQDDKAETLLPTKEGELKNSPTVILCMKKELTSSKKGKSLWPF